LKSVKLSLSVLGLVLFVTGCSQDYSKHPEIIALKSDMSVVNAVKLFSGDQEIIREAFEKETTFVPGELIVRYENNELETGIEIWQFDAFQ